MMLLYCHVSPLARFRSLAEGAASRVRRPPIAARTSEILLCLAISIGRPSMGAFELSLALLDDADRDENLEPRLADNDVTDGVPVAIGATAWAFQIVLHDRSLPEG